MRFSKRLRGLILISVLALAAGASAQTNGLPEIPAAGASDQTNGLPEISATDASNYVGLQVVVTDNVVQVVFRPTIWLLHLNQRYPNSPLNCVVRGHSTNNFPNFEDYLGRRVEVTGRITDHGDRLEMVLTDPNQIKIINTTEINPEPAPPAAAPQIKAALPALPATALAPATPPPMNAGDNSGRALGWILGSLAVIVVLLAFGLFLLWRRTDQARATRSAGALAKLLDDPAADSASAREWKQRALVAEAMAGKQGQMLREKIMPELTEFAKQSLVQGLYAQRNALLETQQKAHQALMELESRLTALQLPLHERIRAYETRIAELEREVETQGQEVRELTRATLALVRKKLEDERERERTQSRFN